MRCSEPIALNLDDLCPCARCVCSHLCSLPEEGPSLPIAGAPLSLGVPLDHTRQLSDRCAAGSSDGSSGQKEEAENSGKEQAGPAEARGEPHAANSALTKDKIEPRRVCAEHKAVRWEHECLAGFDWHTVQFRIKALHAIRIRPMGSFLPASKRLGRFFGT